MRYVLSVLLILAGATATCVWGPAVARLPLPWLWLVALGLAGANLLAWYWIVRPYQLRERRLDLGLCAACGYDLAGNASGVCPECGSVFR